jgi:lysozyme
MTDDERLYAQITASEGRKDKPYLCTAGKMTIGVGHNFEDNRLTPKQLWALFSNGVSQAGIDIVLHDDVEAIRAALRRAVASFTGWPPARQAALIDMGMMGVPRLMGFTKMWAAVDRGDWSAAADEALDSKWAREDVPSWRSKRDADQIRTGEWSV